MFKSNKTLFFKYFGKNLLKTIKENRKKYLKVLNMRKICKIINNTDDINIKVNYTNNLQTTSEDNSNTINNVKLLIKGEEDKIINIVIKILN